MIFKKIQIFKKGKVVCSMNCLQLNFKYARINIQSWKDSLIYL